MSARASTHTETRVELAGMSSMEKAGLDGISITLRDATSLYYALRDELIREGVLEA